MALQKGESYKYSDPNCGYGEEVAVSRGESGRRAFAFPASP
jgi:hypothetical protein